MYRYTVDNAITYTSEDFVLFRESPFACWMERLTLENPDHGIPPDVGSSAPQNSVERQDDIVDTLYAEGRNVSLVDWDLDEPARRTGTLEAMRGGADFIVNGQLALGPLSGSANLLMRTSGYSELGDFLYIPCDTQAKTTLHSAFRLSFLADLLHSLQGQLPPQMLIIRGGSDVVPLQTEDHIYHYRAVKQRFMDAMRNFRKHRMPDPAESSHFGRWSDCANEVLKQRALRQEQQEDAGIGEKFEMPLLQAAGAGEGYDLDDIRQTDFAAPQEAGPDRAHRPETGSMVAAESPGLAAPLLVTDSQPVATRTAVGSATGAPAGGVVAYSSDNQGDSAPTLAEQALMLTPGAYKKRLNASRPGFTPNLARARANRAAAATDPSGGEAATRPRHNRRSSDVALENLEFIGSSHRAPLIGVEAPYTTGQVVGAAEADAPESDPVEYEEARYREDEYREPEVTTTQASFAPAPAPELIVTPAVASSFASPPSKPRVAAAPHHVKPHPLDSAGFNIGSSSGIDMDAAPPPVLKPLLAADGVGLDRGDSVDPDCATVHTLPDHHEQDEEAARLRTFSNSLITNDDFDN